MAQWGQSPFAALLLTPRFDHQFIFRKGSKINLAPAATMIHARDMPALTIDLPAQDNQTEFNLRRWAELLADTSLGRELARIQGRIETDRHGHIIMFPPPGYSHGSYQLEIGSLLKSMLPHGRAVTECPISTADGVKAAAVAWISKTRLEAIGENICLTKAREICVEVLSPDNTRVEMAEKKTLYFAAGSEEVWFCDQTGKMTFYCAPNSDAGQASIRCPNFPRRIVL
jgi:Uma2 family endonuclease